MFATFNNMPSWEISMIAIEFIVNEIGNEMKPLKSLEFRPDPLFLLKGLAQEKDADIFEHDELWSELLQ
jgi:hypothetical protein